jgi:hypothetical protein
MKTLKLAILKPIALAKAPVLFKSALILTGLVAAGTHIGWLNQHIPDLLSHVMIIGLVGTAAWFLLTIANTELHNADYPYPITSPKRRHRK